MLRLSAPDLLFDIDITEYQFPSVALDGWDSEWLQVRGKVQSGQLAWEFYDPCITTFELVRLAEWLLRVPVGGQGREIGFTEPNLRFEHVAGTEGDTLCVYLSQEAAPPGATEEEKFGDGYVLRIPSSTIDFSAASTAVREMCQKFPVRAKFK